MLSSRRHVLRTGATVGTALLGGCSAFDSRATVRRLVVDLENWTDEPHSFHLAVETAGGLGEWRTVSVPAGDGRTITPDSPDDRPFVAVHGVVADRAVRAEADRIDFGGSACPHLVFRYRVSDEESVTLAFTTDTSCD